jgi:hypothetical protein
MDMAIQETAAARPEALRKRLGDRVRLLRFQRRWTRVVLAEITGLHRNYIGHIERTECSWVAWMSPHFTAAATFCA